MQYYQTNCSKTRRDGVAFPKVEFDKCFLDSCQPAGLSVKNEILKDAELQIDRSVQVLVFQNEVAFGSHEITIGDSNQGKHLLSYSTSLRQTWGHLTP
jgi:hypothetical protein